MASTNSISSIINQNQFLELQPKQSLIQAFRAATGRFKILADTTVKNSTSLATEPEFSFSVKAGRPYVISGNLLWNVYATTGPVGNLKFQLTAPGHTNNLNADGQGLYTVSGSAGTILQLGTVANTPFASPNVASVQMFNSSLISANTATAAYSSNFYFSAYIVPVVDDVITLQFAQAAATNTAGTILQKGSWMNCEGLSGSRRSPGVV